MLPFELLKTKITNKGKRIVPLFCLPSADNILLAQKLITEFHLANTKKETKGNLQKRFSIYEDSYDDFKLIRGLIVLLERRCIFKINNSFYLENNAQDFGTQLPSSFSVRKVLFEESSKIGLPIDNIRRKKILEKVALKLDIGIEYLEKIMWLDQEDYMILENFTLIDPIDLLGVYNLAILQTLLFNSVSFEFSLKGGTNWKQVLRNIKRFGLMYNLQKVKKEDNSTKEIQDNKNNQDIVNNDYSTSYLDDNIICSIDGPLSIFKLTNKYGSSIAKVIPKIISSHKWNIKALIIKNSISGRKLYEFNLSSDSDIYIKNSINNKFNNVHQLEDSTSNNSDFDSSVESKFASQFEKLKTGWKLKREPNPLILPDGKAFIPDFLFEKYDIKVYFEIIGFWTPKYLERKFKKINEIMKINNNSKHDFLIAINENNFVSENNDLKKILSNSILNNNAVTIYKKDVIPMKKILSYLKITENKITDQNLETYKSTITDYIIDLLSKNYELINLEEISKLYGVSNESLYDIFSKLPANSHTENYIIQSSLLISKQKLNRIIDEIGNNDNLMKIQEIFENNNIPIQHTIDILKHMGFEVLWKGMDPSNITIKRKK